jgi:thiol:disulfide interchange protein DsbD
VGLNLSGVFEVPGIGAGEALTRRGGPAGAFFTGVLAVAVAAPCTAPFMAAALGYALTQSPAISLVVFLALGIGFAAPFVAIGLSPALTRWLPKPGAWMVRFRQFLAFPMYATALWLVWVLSFETDQAHTLLLLGLALLIAFALWIFGSTQGRSGSWRALGWLALLIAVVTTPLLLMETGTGARTSAAVADIGGIASQPYSASALQSLRAQHRPVFINATAAWCITCLVNEKVAFSDASVRSAFASKHIAYLVADWTNRNPEITALLQAHGRSGVPLYLYYPSGGTDPVVLPQVLTPAAVRKAIGA